MTFGEKLKFYRKKKNITQRDLAKTAGLGFNTISNYERGQTYPRTVRFTRSWRRFSRLTPIFSTTKTTISSARPNRGTESAGVRRRSSL